MEKPTYILEIYKDKKKEFRFRLMHRNGNEIFKSSEGYKRKATMIRVIDAVFEYNILAGGIDLTEKTK